MLKSYFTLAVRNFLKNKTFSFINLFGLAVGLACVLMILSFIRYELSYDCSYSNAKRAYRLVEQTRKGTTDDESISVHSGLAAALQREFAEIEAVTYPSKTKFEFINRGEGINLDALRADTNFFKVFNLPFVQGNPNITLKPHHVVISERVAHTYFPNQNPVGEKLISDDPSGKKFINEDQVAKKESIVVGVMKDIPKTTHFSADVILFETIETDALNYLEAHSGLPQYVLLKDNSNIRQVEKKLGSFYRKYGFPQEKAIRFQPVQSIHLRSNIADEPFANGDIQQVYIFSFVAALILLIGCINYVNLTTARSLQRVQEVGVRKVLGADRRQLAFQFIGESFLFFCTALPLAFCLAHLSWPLFTHIMAIETTTTELFSLENLLLIAVISIVSGILSGAYPALFLSRLKPASLLKDYHKGFSLNIGLRKALIVLQFVISVSLIIATIVVYKQLHYINNKPLGFNKNHLLVLPYRSYGQKWEAFKNELRSYHNIENATLSSWNVGETYGAWSSMSNPKDSTKELSFAFVDADVDFIKTMGVKLLEGRLLSNGDAIFAGKIDSLMFFGKKTPEEFLNLMASRSIIISDNTAATLGLKRPVGEVLKLGALQGTIVGVIADFQGLSLRQKNMPLVLRATSVERGGYGTAYIRVGSKDIRETIAFIQAKWKRIFPANKFDFSFVDERLQKLYDVERRLASLFTVFALLAICIACFGLFSLVALMVQQRTKEVGIRKVLGASVGEIVKLISIDFVKLVLIGICIAAPAAWWLMDKWLQDFAFRISIGWWVIALSGFVALFIAAIAISFQALRAAVANPVHSLRSE